MNPVSLNRRQFLKTSAFAGGMLLTLSLSGASNASSKEKQSGLGVYVHITKDNRIFIASPVMEMGQHMKTTGPMILADELDVAWEQVTLQADCPAFLTRNEEGELQYQFADMGTGGSHAVRRNWDYLRQAGAIARRMLLEQAAQLWQVPVDALRTESGYVLHPSGRTLSYGYLAEGAATQKVDLADITLKKPDEYRIMGADTVTADIHDIVTGKPVFGIDAEYPNALQVVILRAAAQGTRVARFDANPALAVKGVMQVVALENRTDKYANDDPKQIGAAGLAIVADSLWAALQGRQALLQHQAVKWQVDPSYENQSSSHMMGKFRHLVAGDFEATTRKQDGNVSNAFAEAKTKLDSTYETPLFAHACMEPFNCIADIGENEATIVVGHQFPDKVARTVENLIGIDGLRVKVVSKRMGGGFGRRWEEDYLAESVLLSKSLGKPVKITWTREDEIERDYYAPAYVMRVQASLDESDRLSGWHHRQAQTRGGARDDCFPAKLVKNYHSEHFAYPNKIPTGPWRGPGHMQWTFAVESMFDELAEAAGEDPLAFRLNLMRPHKAHEYGGWGADKIDSGRMAICYEQAAKLAQWDKPRPENHGLGIAGHFTFGSYAAFVLEVSVDAANNLQLHKAWGAIDCGFAINPNHVRNQMEGGFIDGLSAALFNEVEIVKGQAMNNNFHSLRLMRLREAPVSIDVNIIENDYPPTGVGEPPTAPAAAALANAIYAASGKRVRSLPIAKHFSI